MSSNTSGITLDLRLAPSVRAMRVLLALHAVAIALTFLAAPPRWIALGIAALILMSWLSLRRHPVFGYGPRALVRLVAHADGGWLVERASGASGRFERVSGGPVGANLTVIRFIPAAEDGPQSSRSRIGGGRHLSTRVLCGDEAPHELLRLLRARLLLGEARPPLADRPASSNKT